MDFKFCYFPDILRLILVSNYCYTSGEKWRSAMHSWGSDSNTRSWFGSRVRVQNLGWILIQVCGQSSWYFLSSGRGLMATCSQFRLLISGVQLSGTFGGRTTFFLGVSTLYCQPSCWDYWIIYVTALFHHVRHLLKTIAYKNNSRLKTNLAEKISLSQFQSYLTSSLAHQTFGMNRSHIPTNQHLK